VEGNALSTLQGLEALTSLRTLHAAKNLLRSLGGLPASLTALEVLDVSQCFITSCAGLSALVNLRSLNLSANKLTSAADLAELPGCTALQTLDLSANQLAGEGVLQLLADAPWQLALLRLHGNPVVSQTT
jgi:Leucine-rich repeat (LRR) protein